MSLQHSGYEYVIDYWSLNTNTISMIEKLVNSCCKDGWKVAGTAVDTDNRFIVTFERKVYSES